MLALAVKAQIRPNCTDSDGDELRASEKGFKRFFVPSHTT
jgi:hypothetical protein